MDGKIVWGVLLLVNLVLYIFDLLLIIIVVILLFMFLDENEIVVKN